ncbi:MAG: gluconate 2-dehydrogenase subunit 3 family protein [Gemmatimonadota bacterium]
MTDTTNSKLDTGGPTRRDVLKAAGLGGLALPILDRTARLVEGRKPEVVQLPAEGPRGTPTDPDLIHPKIWWEKVLSAEELVTLVALCDLIIPADHKSPSASQVGVPDYINEWASAPYEWAREGLTRIRDGLAWLNTESERRFGRAFAGLGAPEQTAIADDICYQPKAKPELLAAARFFDLIRDLSSTGFYTTREGMKDLGYIGNVPMPRWDGPPPEVLKHLGL